MREEWCFECKMEVGVLEFEAKDFGYIVKPDTFVLLLDSQGHHVGIYNKTNNLDWIKSKKYKHDMKKLFDMCDSMGLSHIHR